MKTQKIRRGRPVFANSQRGEILRLLRQAGPRGVSRAYLIFDRFYTQCGARVDELKREGYVIRSEDRGGRYPTWYVLESEPFKSAQQSADFFDGHRATGLPLFDSAAVRR
jgi:hypothetical protein